MRTLYTEKWTEIKTNLTWVLKTILASWGEIWAKWNNTKLWPCLLDSIYWVSVSLRRKFSEEKLEKCLLCSKKESISMRKYRSCRLTVELIPKVEQEGTTMNPQEEGTEWEKSQVDLLSHLKWKTSKISILARRLVWRQQQRRKNNQ